jgi:hypothetical protein
MHGSTWSCVSAADKALERGIVSEPHGGVWVLLSLLSSICSRFFFQLVFFFLIVLDYHSQKLLSPCFFMQNFLLQVPEIHEKEKASLGVCFMVRKNSKCY